NNIIHDNDGAGIRAESSSLSVFSNNTLFNNAWGGIRLGGGIYLGEGDTSYGNIISNNIAHHGRNGIWTWGVTNTNSYVGNILYNNENGLAIEASNNSLMINNTIYSNNNGILVHLGPEEEDKAPYNNTIAKNIVYDNFKNGISIQYGKENNIENNLIYNNNEYGVYTEVSSFKTNVMFNELRGHILGNGYDDGSGNIYSNNYYDDWSGSGSYLIDGSANNQDPTPNANPNHMSSISLTIENNNNQTLSGNVFISWNHSVDTFSHSITYSVLYSPNDGISWITVVSDLTEMNYTLNTSIIADGTNVSFKVQGIDELGFVTQVITNDTYQIANSLHTLSLSVNSPNDVQSRIMTISWLEATDSWGHELVYDLYYSNDNGNTWEFLALDLTSTSFNWDTTTVNNGEYIIKVVARDTEGASIEAFSLSFAIENIISTASPDPTTLGESSTIPPSSSGASLNLNIVGLFIALTAFVILN
ncbi:hypothetical protein LCGC14_2568140, partial [marine sediment metagenome]